jgi:hypothetical protein
MLSGLTPRENPWNQDERTVHTPSRSSKGASLSSTVELSSKKQGGSSNFDSIAYLTYEEAVTYYNAMPSEFRVAHAAAFYEHLERQYGMKQANTFIDNCNSELATSMMLRKYGQILISRYKKEARSHLEKEIAIASKFNAAELFSLVSISTADNDLSNALSWSANMAVKLENASILWQTANLVAQTEPNILAEWLNSNSAIADSNVNGAEFAELVAKYSIKIDPNASLAWSMRAKELDQKDFRQAIEVFRQRTDNPTKSHPTNSP